MSKTFYAAAKDTIKHDQRREGSATRTDFRRHPARKRTLNGRCSFVGAARGEEVSRAILSRVGALLLSVDGSHHIYNYFMSSLITPHRIAVVSQSAGVSTLPSPVVQQVEEKEGCSVRHKVRHKDEKGDD